MVDSLSQKNTPLWRDDRVWSAIVQVIVMAIVIGFYGLLLYNFNVNLQRIGLNFSFGFLTDAAGFSIGETPIDYTPTDPYLKAIFIGAINTFRLIIIAFMATTALGITMGIASFSQNWLVRKISQIYVEIIRNTPLLLQLLFWYFVVFLSLPKSSEPLQALGSVFLSKGGLQMPWPALTVSFWIYLGILIILGISALLVYRWRIAAMVQRGEAGTLQIGILWGIGIASLLILTIAFQWETPQLLENGRLDGGLHLSIEYASVFAGLVVYTAAFIAEIVRGGIQSVSKGQWEAARSLGLHQSHVMQLVVFPQALRVIIPPLNSQYMNLAKNSSLALAIGYPDLYSVTSTTLNQTGRPMEVFLILMTFYLGVNLVISLIMNTANRLVQIKER